ncbi:hypothetical protein BGZ70_002743 [Mortierella alpina]|uniref:FAD-binding domain-containing protein n=1 Tax=Mortierella alpina TaxID=64518 RepID=A0A9P6JBF8_MORAP|nr:hypothetical protein BGZ70_002743 [Mortierella alpina]
MSLGANILPVFEQLGLYKPLMEIALPIVRMNMFTENTDAIGVVEVDDSKTLIGYNAICFPRPDLYDLILSQVPLEKIHFNKKVVALHEDETQVTIDCEDGSSYHGDILVGADGAYSSIRQLLYEKVSLEGLLPPSDSEDLSLSCGPEANESMIKEIYNFNNGVGGIMGELTDTTPRERISKVMLEEKLFETWHSGRVAPLGDDASQRRTGYIKAMQDAVILTNCLYDLEAWSTHDISAAFAEYKDQRYHHAKYHFEISKTNAQIMRDRQVKLPTCCIA